jgi:hypothetical protein
MGATKRRPRQEDKLHEDKTKNAAVDRVRVGARVMVMVRVRVRVRVSREVFQ